MIYYSADDYGLCDTVSAHIRQCVEAGKLNKVSVFPNQVQTDLSALSEQKDVRICLHLNLVEGKCMAETSSIDLLADSDGTLKHTFGGLLKLNLLQSRKLEAQMYREIKAQVLYWKGILPEGVPFCIDSHQHAHMIPAVFRALLRVLEEEKIDLAYMRIPAEPMLPYIKTPSLYFTYSAVNVIKQWLLKFLWMLNKKHAKKFKIPTALFMGILFSGKMDAKRVQKLLPKYIVMAEKRNMDIEVLFHPGYTENGKADLKDANIVFNKFYISPNRKTEFDSVMNIAERSVQNALY